jgi:5-oxoprolinase (ATP-hydrolysing)
MGELSTWKNTAMMEAGDRIVVQSPGGGAWGAVGEKGSAAKNGLDLVKTGFVAVANGSVDIIQSMGESA